MEGLKLMHTIDTVKGQTLMDIAIQEYGNIAAMFIILEDNPHLAGMNKYEAGQLVDPFCDFDIGHPIKEGISINIRKDSDLENLAVLRELNGQIIISE
jgi:hypothetical protein